MVKRDPFIELSEIEAKEVRWLFRPFIPFSMITILEGDPGLGKSFLAMYIAAAVSRGGLLPNEQRVDRGKVVYLAAEDDAAYTIRPRMESMGADLERIIVLDDLISLDENGLVSLTKEVRDSSPTLIVLDPLLSFMPAGGDPYRPTIIRPFLGELKAIAEKADAALLIVRHLAKATNANALYRGTGSIDQIAMARSAIRVAKHPDNPELRVLVHVKHNISERGRSLLFEIVKDDDGKPLLAWRGETDIVIEDLDKSEDEDDKSAFDDAKEFLKEILSGGPVAAKVVASRAESVSISKRTLERAKEALKVESSKKGGGWFWSLQAPD